MRCCLCNVLSVLLILENEGVNFGLDLKMKRCRFEGQGRCPRQMAVMNRTGSDWVMLLRIPFRVLSVCQSKKVHLQI